MWSLVCFMQQYYSTVTGKSTATCLSGMLFSNSEYCVSWKIFITKESVFFFQRKLWHLVWKGLESFFLRKKHTTRRVVKLRVVITIMIVNQTLPVFMNIRVRELTPVMFICRLCALNKYFTCESCLHTILWPKSLLQGDTKRNMILTIQK